MRWGLVCIALVGCFDTDAPSAVNGMFVDRLYTAQGIVDQPTDTSARGFRIYINGRWYPESGLTYAAFDGTIYLEIPDGPYLLNTVYADGSMTWDQREEHDFVEVVTRIGRPGAQLATNVPMQLQLTNLAPWSVGGDEIYVDCYENGTEHRSTELATSLTEGATQLSSTFDWATSPSAAFDWLTRYRAGYLIDAEAGDTLTVSRTSVVSDGNLGVARVSQIARGTVSTQRDGEPSSFTGTFGDVLPTASQQFSVDMPAIAAQVPEVNGWVIGLWKSPASVAFDTFGPPLLAVSPGTVDTTPITFTESYGDPFDAGWALLAKGTYGLYPPYVELPRGKLVYPGWTMYATVQRIVEPGAGFTLEPTADFVTSASIDGHALEGDVPWDGESPLSLHVEVPAGVAGFTADVLWVPAEDIYPRRWTTVRSQRTDVVLPVDAFQLGQDYFVRVGVTTETETSRSTTYKLLGPFRLVRP